MTSTSLILCYPALHEYELAHTMNWQICQDPNRFTRREILLSFFRLNEARKHPDVQSEMVATVLIALKSTR